jgi:hypothetical protein
MRMAGVVCALVFAIVCGAALAGVSTGEFELEGGSGVFVVRGNGGLLGRVVSGSVRVIDLSPNDRWHWSIDGVTVPGRRASATGSDLTLRILGGSYLLIVRGDGVSLSARGNGTATLEGIPGPDGATGVFSTDPNSDCQASPASCNPVPASLERVPFGGA